ncbi:hypothetical protein [Pararobbsia silviterrae]|nr:hypothetical protein [Pararobbsia silviterrae]
MNTLTSATANEHRPAASNADPLTADDLEPVSYEDLLPYLLLPVAW